MKNLLCALLLGTATAYRYGFGNNGGIKARAFYPTKVYEGEEFKVRIQTVAWDHIEDDSNYDLIVSLQWSSPQTEMNQKRIRNLNTTDVKEFEIEFVVPKGTMENKPNTWSSLQIKLDIHTYDINGIVESYPWHEASGQLEVVKRQRILVQSDKAKYKPGNTVQFRIIVVDDELNPLESDLKYKIVSPSKNIMAQVEQNNAAKVLEGVFQLDQFAEQGDWTIEISSTDVIEHYTLKEDYIFTVEEYVLPKYEVRIIGDGFVISGDEYPFVVETEYTFGQPVPGDAVIKVRATPCYRGYDSYRYDYHLEIYCEPFEDCPNTEDPSLTKTTINSDGSVGTIMTSDDISKLLDPSCQGQSLDIEANWVDNASGEEITAFKTVKVENTRYDLEWLYKPTVYKKKLGLIFIGKVSLIDGSTLDVSGKMQIKLDINYNAYYNKDLLSDLNVSQQTILKEYTEDVIEIPIALEDAGVFQFRVPDEIMEIGIELDWGDFKLVATFVGPDMKSSELSEWIKKPKAAYELTISSAADSMLSPGQVFELEITADYVGTAQFYIVSNGKVLSEESIIVDAGEVISKSVLVTHQMVPEVKFLVVGYSTTSSSNDWAADTISYFVEPRLANEVNLSPSKNKVELGDKIDLVVNAARNSPVYLLGVDKSVLLLKDGNDIDEKRVLGLLSSSQGYTPWPIWGGCGFWFPWGYGSDAKEKIEDAGFSTIELGDYSMDEIYMAYSDNIMYDMDMYMAGPPPVNAIMESSPPLGSNGKQAPPIETRKKFPETWIWNKVTTDENGEAKIEVTVPDTITSWIVTGFSLSPENGLGYQKDPSKILAFRDFFVKLDLPYSIKQNEEFLVKAIVYNYLGEAIDATVTLEKNDGIILLAETYSKTVSIPSNNRVPVGWPVKVINSGVIPLKVTAIAAGNIAGDALERVLIVKPEGIARSQTFNTLLRGDESEEIQVQFPSNVVEGSERIEIRVFGDILSNTLQNLDSLLKMPYGCGEQNMINFAPAVFIYEYLTKSGGLTEEIEAKASRYIQQGYQRELTYKHHGGGFSAFGESSYSKSGAATLLTAFVVKCFRAAEKLSKKFVDLDELNVHIDFLASKFNTKTGHFEEDGKVFSSYIKGSLDADGEVAITAYTLIPFLEGGAITRYQSIIDSALDTLVDAIPSASSPHTLAIITYCLKLGGRPEAKAALDKVNSLAVEDAGANHWMVEDYHGKKPSVEVASYILMTYGAENDDFLPIFRGIISQLSDTGGFQSTQDTVIGIQAMAQRATMFVNEDDNLDIVANLDGKFVWQAETLTSENAKTVQIEHIQFIDKGTFEIASSGKGSAFAQVVIHYNVKGTSNDPFKVDFMISNSPKRRRRNADQFDNDFCIRVITKATDNKDFRVPDGMSLVTIEHPSGFRHSLVTPMVKMDEPEMIEINPDKTVLYYNNLAEPVGVTICMSKVENVENPRPVYITVQDYYNPSAASEIEVTMDDLRVDDAVCDLCGDLCQSCRSIPAIPTGNDQSSSRPQVVSPWIFPQPSYVIPPEVLKFYVDNDWDRQKFENYVRKLKDSLEKNLPRKILDMTAMIELMERHFQVFQNILNNILK